MSTNTTVTELIGSKLEDRFELTEIFSQGGMSLLFKGQDLTNGKPIAIRVLHSSRVNDKQSMNRFQIAFNAASKLDHPKIIAPLAQGFTKRSNLPYLVYPFLDATNLRNIIKERTTLGAEGTIDILLQVSEALKYAHDHDVVHRNLKPGNILIEPQEDGKQKVSLTGFGIARPMQVLGTTVNGLTQTNRVIGSPTYMSPEQFLSRELGPYSDIYSLGHVAYEMLTGKPAFGGENVLALMQQHVNEYPSKIRKERPEVPEWLENAIWCMFAKQPSERYATTDELMSDLNAGTCTRAISIISVPPQAVPTPVKPPSAVMKFVNIYATLGVVASLAVGAIIVMQLVSMSNSDRQATLRASQLDADAPTRPTPPSARETLARERIAVMKGIVAQQSQPSKSGGSAKIALGKDTAKQGVIYEGKNYEGLPIRVEREPWRDDAREAVVTGRLDAAAKTLANARAESKSRFEIDRALVFVNCLQGHYAAARQSAGDYALDCPKETYYSGYARMLGAYCDIQLGDFTAARDKMLHMPQGFGGEIFEYINKQLALYYSNSKFTHSMYQDAHDVRAQVRRINDFMRQQLLQL